MGSVLMPEAEPRKQTTKRPSAQAEAPTGVAIHEPKAKVCRTRRQIDASVVKGWLFTFLPALEGKWSGNAQTGKDLQEQACSIKISYSEDKGGWEIRTTLADTRGVATNTTLLLQPT